MAEIQIPNVRQESTVLLPTRLKDNGVTVDWSSLSDIKAYMYSDAQCVIAGKCTVEVDGEDSAVLNVTYPATRPQYLGVNSLLVRCKYQGREKTYDVPVLNFVERTAEATGVTVLEDPVVNVSLEVNEVSTSLLDGAIAAALDAAIKAEEAASLVPLEVLEEAREATEAATEAAEAANAAGITSVEASIADNEPGTPSVDATLLNKALTLVFHHLKGLKGDTGVTPNISVGTVSTGAPGSPVVVTITGTAEAPVLNLTIPQGLKGDQGNTGSSVDYPFELVNNLTTDDATKALSAAQGVVLEGEISQLSQVISAPTAFSESASFTSEFYANEGDVVIVDITAISASTQYSLFTVGFNSDVYAHVNRVGKIEITALHDGYLRFYRESASGTIEGTLAYKSYLTEQFDSLNEDVAELNATLGVPSVPSLGSIAITTIEVGDSVTFALGKRYVFDKTATIDNYTNYEYTSLVQACTAPIQIRSNGGLLIYKNLRLKSTSVPSSGLGSACAHFFGKDGKFLRSISYNLYVARETPILSDEYYAIFCQYPTQSRYADAIWVVSPVGIGWLNKPEEYRVGQGKDFTTFTAMLNALQNNHHEKIVYVDPGEYDIFEEMGGADYMASLADTASTLNWRDVCPVVPPNTTIIGIGNVVLKWLPTAAQMVSYDVAFLFSPLNLSGTCTIENITILAQNCRYAVHDETSALAQFDGATHKFINCRLEHRQSSTGHSYAYGAGHNKLMTLSFKDCYFYSFNTTPWSTHDHAAGVNECSKFVFDNCIFESGGSKCLVRFSTSDTAGRKDKVQMNNCYIGPTARISFGVEGSATNKMQGYVVTMVGCTQAVVEHSSGITTTYETKQYLPQS